MTHTPVSRIFAAFRPVLLYHLASAAVFVLMERLAGAKPYLSTAAVTMTALLLLPFLLRAYKKDRKAERLPVSGKNQPRGYRLVLICLGCLLLGAVLSVLSAQLMARLDLYERFGNEAQEELLAAPLLLKLIGLGLLVPAAEEAAYRGLLCPRLKAVLPPFTAVLIASAVFALGHGNMVQSLYAFPMSLLLCAVYEKSGGCLAVPICLHMGANLISLLPLSL